MPKIEKMPKSTAAARLANAPPDQRFWCQDGRVFENIEQLQAGLANMSDETYRYHANESKNDFSNWVKDVIGDDKLARDLRNSSNAGQALRRVAQRVAFLKMRAAG